MTDENKSREELLEEIYALRRENQALRAAAGKKTGANILIVDDNEDTRELVSEMVRELGHKALAAATAQEALDIVSNSRSPIHLIISDVVMPGGDGPLLMKALTGAAAQTQVIFMSGYAGDEIVHDGVYQVQDAQAAFIQKPFTTAELGKLIRAYIS